MTTQTIERVAATVAGISLPAGKKVSKIERYGWILRDLPGEFMTIDKNEIQVDHSYQRNDVSQQKVAQIARSFAWAGFGAISVALRPDGSLFCFEGQHRLLAAVRRPDITTVPCMVFECESVEQEAAGFLITNEQRRNPTAIDKFKAQVQTSDKAAVHVMETLDRLGLEVSRTAIRDGQIKCVKRCMVLCNIDKDAFDKAIEVADMVCRGQQPVKEDLVNSLFLCHRKHGLLDDRRFVRRVKDVGQKEIIESIRKTRALGDRGDISAREGLLRAVNKGLQKRFGQQD